MDGASRVPPRFVPTLTTVVELKAPSQTSPDEVSGASEPSSPARPAVPQASREQAPSPQAPMSLDAFVLPASLDLDLNVGVPELPSGVSAAATPGFVSPASLLMRADGGGTMRPAAPPAVSAKPVVTSFESSPFPAVETVVEAPAIPDAAVSVATDASANTNAGTNAGTHVDKNSSANPNANVSGADATPIEDATADAVRSSFTEHVALARVNEDDAFRIEEELLHRVLQRVDLSLEERLTDVVSAAVQQQLDAMIPRLRTEVERVLRQLVVDALARELSETPGSATAGANQSLG